MMVRQTCEFEQRLRSMKYFSSLFFLLLTCSLFSQEKGEQESLNRGDVADFTEEFLLSEKAPETASNIIEWTEEQWEVFEEDLNLVPSVEVPGLNQTKKKNKDRAVADLNYQSKFDEKGELFDSYLDKEDSENYLEHNSVEFMDETEENNPYQESYSFDEKELYQESFSEDEQEILSHEKAVREPYRLRIGDSFYVSIYGERNTGRVVTVDSSGSINYLLVDSVFVLGKTIDQVRYELNEKVDHYFTHAMVTVSPIRFGGLYYTILGEVRAPGKRQLIQKMTLRSAIAQAGGLRTGTFRSQTTELADLDHAFLSRNGDYVPVDFERLIRKGDSSQDIVLENGDYIFIPSAIYREVYVLGEVARPTALGYLNTMSVVEALAQVGGITDNASSRAIVVRGSLSNPIRLEVDINRVMKGLAKDVYLQPGDIVFVPTFRFQNLKDMVKVAIRAFVGNAASIASSRTAARVLPGEINNITPVITVP